MKFSVVAAATFLGLASAQNAVVVNNCDKTIYVQSVPYDGSDAGPLTTVEAGDSFSEEIRESGSTIKIGTSKTLAYPLFFGYSVTDNPNNAYYEFSTEFGNPFAESANSLSAGEGCMEFLCDAGDAGCYSTPEKKKVYGCPRPVDLTAMICA